jgi:cyclopropane fatty-acyl-phospholipid synthase-like methyltransferase
MNLLPCRLCGFPGITVVMKLSGMPRWNHRLLREHELSSDKVVDLEVHRCPSCGFVSLPLQLSDDYYDDYVNAPSLSPQAQKFQSDQAIDFVERFSLSGRRVLEIGCGDGYFLHAMKEAGADCFGIEPSNAQRELALARGLKVEAGVLSSGRRLSAAPFDAFITRQVFEHVSDMRDFLLTIRSNLRPEAVGFVEVPNLDKIVDEERFFDFIPEHINYFTSRSLCLALQLAGFEVIEICPVQEGEALRALVRWVPLPEYALIASRVDLLRRDISKFMADCQSQGKNVAIWGAGGKGLSMMAVTDLRSVKLLVDSDPHKAGLFTPISHFRVELPGALAHHEIDVIIVMAPAYEREIVASLRRDFGFIGTIVLAGRGFENVEPSGDLN